MNCRDVLSLLDAYRTGELCDSDLRTVAEHLSGCAACSREISGLEKLAAGSARLRKKAPASLTRELADRSSASWGEIHTVIGRVRIAFSRRGISMIAPACGPGSEFERLHIRRRGNAVRPGKIPDGLARAVSEAIAGRPGSAAPIDLGGLPEFAQSVLQNLRRIPRGEVRPYGWLAKEAGRPAAVRAVGTVMARNPVPFLLPCHRVVPATGGIGNYAFGSVLKRELLQREGAPIDEIEAFSREGVKFVGCRSTGIYCFPSCRDARRILPAHRIPFPDSDGAREAGFRPCLHCRPE
jgi:O-6-methylguanine DNA methyltransferase